MPWVRTLIYPSTCMTSSTGAIWSTPTATSCWTGSNCSNFNQTATTTTWRVDSVQMAAYRAYEAERWREEVDGEIDDLQQHLARVSQAVAQPHVRSSARQADVQRIDAEAKARELLLASLTPDQRASLQRDKWFVVEGKSGRHYRVRDVGHTVANIDVLEGGRAILRLCGHIGDPVVPLADHLLAQKLMLEADEDAFLRLANRHQL